MQTLLTSVEAGMWGLSVNRRRQLRFLDTGYYCYWYWSTVLLHLLVVTLCVYFLIVLFGGGVKVFRINYMTERQGTRIYHFLIYTSSHISYHILSFFSILNHSSSLSAHFSLLNFLFFIWTSQIPSHVSLGRGRVWNDISSLKFIRQNNSKYDIYTNTHTFYN